jgi:hypothetical protein
MTNHLRRIAPTAVLLSVALLSTTARAEIIEQILVKVNGELFTKSDLETRQVAALREMGQRIDPINANLDDAQLRKMLFLSSGARSSATGLATSSSPASSIA